MKIPLFLYVDCDRMICDLCVFGRNNNVEGTLCASAQRHAEAYMGYVRASEDGNQRAMMDAKSIIDSMEKT